MVKLKFDINSYDVGDWWNNKQEYEVELQKKKQKKNENKKTK